MSLCVLAGGKTLAMAASAFTLAWTHSIEKTAWEEDWLATGEGLRLVEARVKGSGAGMEPPEGAVLRDGWWTWRPEMPARPRLVLAASGATASGWSVCAGGECVLVGEEAEGGPIVIESCPAQ